MGNSFTQAHLDYFGAEDGAYSQISSLDEANKRQITLTGHEKEIVLYHFRSEGIFKGPSQDPSGKGRKNFVNNNTGKIVNLGLVYPKPEKNEIRLYMNADFSGTDKDVWYIFRKDEQLHIGMMPLEVWEQIGKNDFQDDVFQQSISSYQIAPPDKTSSIISGYARSAAVAAKSLEQAGYKCEIDPAHATFITPSGKNFMEAHHVIPISKQGDFGTSIDIVENIASLCPTCHRHIHYGSKESKAALLGIMHEKRKAFMESKGIEVDLQKLTDMY